MGKKELYCLTYSTNTIIIAKNKTIYLQHGSQTHKYKSSLICRSQCKERDLLFCPTYFLFVSLTQSLSAQISILSVQIKAFQKYIYIPEEH